MDFKITYRCWNCNKKYTDREVEALKQKDTKVVICPECGGYIRTPRNQMREQGERLDD